ncbi:unnamed protein product [Rotaria sordida]|uniref:Uncharacterized protein n=1 Tax=Rotaria sordida TaxID=392033 RepID=A0A813YQN2_9BILA|nr:unnamed protein product [Rotaria sordida]CAF0887395.1 unnamed protein product [Rotaria sordida]CAF3871174.1 unnamed protein product [Rotaria sordida]CAF3986815.1 unnamed protein product [Rotaria sordida]
MSLTSEQFSGYCDCGGRCCSVCRLCADWYYNKHSQHWKLRPDSTCQRGHVDPDVTDDLKASARQAKRICMCI